MKTGNRGEVCRGKAWQRAALILQNESVKDRSPLGEMKCNPVCSDWMTRDTIFRFVCNNLQDRHGNYIRVTLDKKNVHVLVWMKGLSNMAFPFSRTFLQRGPQSRLCPFCTKSQSILECIGTHIRGNQFSPQPFPVGSYVFGDAASTLLGHWGSS